jgi:hypothetical protein
MNKNGKSVSRYEAYFLTGISTLKKDTVSITAVTIAVVLIGLFTIERMVFI